MKTRLVIFAFLVILFIPLAATAESAQSSINLSVTVSQNIVAYFDGQNIVAKSNSGQPIVITKNKNNTVTITPSL